VTNLLGAGRDEAEFDRLVEPVVRELSGRRGVVVSNEVGMGIVPVNELARSFRDVLGFVNTRFASGAERAVLMVAGRAVELAPI
jgi:adenosylcobyric acid synthase